MFGFGKRIFVSAMMFFGCNLSSSNPSECVSINNQECKVRPELMSRTNERRHIEWHETCKCKFRLNASVCDNKQRWNEDKCRCEGKELIDKDVCDVGFIWNPSNCECECNKLCDIGEYLDYENCKYRKQLVVKLVEDCTETNNEVKLAKITLAENENKH